MGDFDNSKIIVCTYPETTFLEAMYSGVPTILLYKRDCWETATKFDDLIKEKAMMWILAYSDGTYSLKDISDRSKIDFDILKEVGILLLDKQLIKIKST